MGYLGDERNTKKTIDCDGWLHSGDIGKVQVSVLTVYVVDNLIFKPVLIIEYSKQAV